LPCCSNRIQPFTELVPETNDHGFVIPDYAIIAIIAGAAAGGLLLVVVAAGLVARVCKRRYAQF